MQQFVKCRFVNIRNPTFITKAAVHTRGKKQNKLPPLSAYCNYYQHSRYVLSVPLYNSLIREWVTTCIPQRNSSRQPVIDII